MRCLDATMGERERKIVFTGSLIVLALAGFDPADSHAQMKYNGGFIPNRSDSDNAAPRSPVPSANAPAAPKSPRNYSPDGDFGFFLANVETATVPPAFSSPMGAPRMYILEARLLSPTFRAIQSETAVLIAHLPETAVFWVEGKQTRSTGRTRCFQSPLLQVGRKYRYTVRAAWIESGRWVSQTRTIPVGAGLIQDIYLRSALAQ